MSFLDSVLEENDKYWKDDYEMYISQSAKVFSERLQV
jgi:hypothetical protein